MVEITYVKKVFIIIAACLLFSCTSTKYTGSTERDWYVHGRLEETAAGLENATATCRANIDAAITASRKLEDTTERLSYLLGEYDRQVELLLKRVDEERSKIENSN